MKVADNNKENRSRLSPNFSTITMQNRYTKHGRTYKAFLIMWEINLSPVNLQNRYKLSKTATAALTIYRYKT